MEREMEGEVRFGDTAFDVSSFSFPTPDSS
jgi:hypothetical protein